MKRRIPALVLARSGQLERPPEVGQAIVRLRSDGQGSPLRRSRGTLSGRDEIDADFEVFGVHRGVGMVG